MKIVITKHAHERMILRDITNADIIAAVKDKNKGVKKNKHGVNITSLNKKTGNTLMCGVKADVKNNTLTIKTCMYREIDNTPANMNDNRSKYADVRGYAITI